MVLENAIQGNIVMTTVPNLNIVVQQGPHALKALNSQILPLDARGLGGAAQLEKEALIRSTVQQLTPPERTAAAGKNAAAERKKQPPVARGRARVPAKEAAADFRGRKIDAYV